MTLHGHNLSGPVGCVYIGKLQSHSGFFLSCGALLGSPARGGLLPLPSGGRGHLVSSAECGSLQPFWDQGLQCEQLSPEGRCCETLKLETSY